MSYGGISGIVLMFVLMPLTLEILKESRITRYMAPGILLGCIATAVCGVRCVENHALKSTPAVI